MKREVFFIVMLIITGVSCSDSDSNHYTTKKPSVDSIFVSPKENHSKMTNYFPFKIYDDTDRFTVIAGLEDPSLYPKYSDFFEKFGYEGNGYCWEGHITQILEKLQPDLLKRIEFDPEAGGFYAHFKTKEDQLEFVELLSPIFSDFTKLAIYVEKADRSRIDD